MPQTDFRSIVVLSQIMQAFAIKAAVEIHRRSMPFCMGTLYWQFNDCWPAISWSSVDYFGNWKALPYHAKRFFNEIIIVIHEKEECIQISVINDKYKKVKSCIQFQLLTFEGLMLHQKSFDLQTSFFSTFVTFPTEPNKSADSKSRNDLLSSQNSVLCIPICRYM